VLNVSLYDKVFHPNRAFVNDDLENDLQSRP